MATLTDIILLQNAPINEHRCTKRGESPLPNVFFIGYIINSRQCTFMSVQFNRDNTNELMRRDIPCLFCQRSSKKIFVTITTLVFFLHLLAKHVVVFEVKGLMELSSWCLRPK